MLAFSYPSSGSSCQRTTSLPASTRTRPARRFDSSMKTPAGVFMLESKRLAGRVRVEAGKLVVRWHEDPEDGYENASIASRARGAAFDLHVRLELPGQSPWVQAVVVLWA